MESIGRKLKETRERNNYTLEQVARDTHISRNYIAALEAEDFASLPGEPYVYGFLRNYAEYLSLNPDELVSLYKNMRLQEEPMPINELLETGRVRTVLGRIGLIVLGVLVLAGAAFLVYRLRGGPPEGAAEAPAAEAAAKKPAGSTGAVTFDNEVLTRWFNQGDVIRIPVQDRTFDLKIESAKENLALGTPAGPLEMRVGEERALDVDADSQPDVRLVLNDLDRGAARVNLGLYKITTAGAVTAAMNAAAGTTASGATAGAGAGAGAIPGSTPAVPAAGTAPAAGQPGPVMARPVAAGAQAGLRTAQAFTVLQAAEPAPFRVNLTFRGYCLFRYLLDGQNREERFFQKGESFTLDARKDVKLWVSNAGSLRIMVAGRDVEAGRPGEVVAWFIRWRQDAASGKSLLEIVPVD